MIEILETTPKVLTVEGSVSDNAAGPAEARDIVRRLIEYLVDVEGPLERKIFKKATPKFADEYNFQIEFVLNQE